MYVIPLSLYVMRSLCQSKTYTAGGVNSKLTRISLYNQLWKIQTHRMAIRDGILLSSSYNSVLCIRTMKLHTVMNMVTAQEG